MSQLDIFAAQSIADERMHTVLAVAGDRRLTRREGPVPEPSSMSVWERLMAALDPSRVVPDVRAC
ncbi:MAG TPA: hypothetical protein VK045_14990 [Ornithinicoccus sp.]|nr:hypothetical protein [Ornithinicoccus sp.]